MNFIILQQTLTSLVYNCTQTESTIVPRLSLHSQLKLYSPLTPYHQVPPPFDPHHWIERAETINLVSGNSHFADVPNLHIVCLQMCPKVVYGLRGQHYLNLPKQIQRYKCTQGSFPRKDDHLLNYFILKKLP